VTGPPLAPSSPQRSDNQPAALALSLQIGCSLVVAATGCRLLCSKIMAPGKSYARTMVGTPYYFSPELVEVRTQHGSAMCVIQEKCRAAPAANAMELAAGGMQHCSLSRCQAC
jgi:hypothetical protein